MSVYPSGIDSFTTKVDGVDDVIAEYVNVLQSGIVALETALGTGTTNFVAKAGDTMTGNLNLAAGVEITAEANFQATASANTIFVGGAGVELNNNVDSRRVILDTYAITLADNNPGGSYLYVRNGGVDVEAADLNLILTGSVLPTVSGVNLGSTGVSFGTLYVDSIVCPTLPTRATRYMEQPSGTVDGNNQAFTLSNVPYDNSLLLYKNGLLMIPSGVSDVTFDFALVGNTITYEVAPSPGALHIAARYEY